MISLKINFLILITSLFLANFFLSCGKIVDPSINEAFASSQIIEKKPLQKKQLTISYGTPAPGENSAKFAFFVGTEIKPLIPNYTGNKTTIFIEDTNSETTTLQQLGFTLNEKTGVISGTPSEKGIGTTIITILSKNKENYIQNAPAFQLIITISLETCPSNPFKVDHAIWEQTHGSKNIKSELLFRYSRLIGNTISCVYQSKTITKSNIFFVLERKNKAFSPEKYVDKHPDQWSLESSNSYYCQPKNEDAKSCYFY